jgi:citrate synthase
MTAAPAREAAGLDGVIALRSSICLLSAADGRLAYRGYDVRTLAEQSTYEETAALLVLGQLPTRVALSRFSAELKSRQKLSPAVLKALKAVPAAAEPMSALRVALSVVALEEPAPLPLVADAALRQGIRLIAVAPAAVAAFHRLRNRARPITPKKSLSFAANFLTMLHGEPASPEAARALDAALILRADNELNPSTFAARVTASTGADVNGSILAALSALAGPRHGWHSRNVMAMLAEVGEADQAEGWARARLAAGGKVTGFGHVVYRGEDPRTPGLRALAEAASARAGQGALFQTASALEQVMAREAGQFPIVDYYLAILYHALGIPTDLFTAVFALSRMAGWVAHVLEQYQEPGLIRPRAEYVGPVDQVYEPVRRRKAKA